MTTKSKTQHGAQVSVQSGNPQAVGQDPRTWQGPFALARRHPALTVAGAATLGLLGGLEVAAGIMVGAAVLALVRGGAAPGVARPHRARELAHGLWSELPRTLRERTRAVIQAARGKPTDQTMAGSTPSDE
jgi:hypothetical protein